MKRRIKATLGFKGMKKDAVYHLWTKLLTKKYLQQESFFSHIPKSGASMVWKAILSSRESLLKGTCYRLGNGLTVRTWEDPWVPTLPGHVPSCKDGIDGSRWRGGIQT